MGYKKGGRCCYCGKIAPVTKDHIPPKNLFPRPRPSNLITVPCCQHCREGWSDDDEYFRAILLSSELTESHVEAKKATEAFLRSLQRPQHGRFLRMLASNITSANVYTTKARLYIGRHPIMVYDRNRVDRVTSRIVRGLFFKRTGCVFPDTHEIITVMRENISGKLDEFALKNKDSFSPPIEVGNSVFAYTVAFAEDNVSSCWVMFFYDRFPIVAFTHPRSKKNTTSTA